VVLVYAVCIYVELHIVCRAAMSTRVFEPKNYSSKLFATRVFDIEYLLGLQCDLKFLIAINLAIEKINLS